MWSDDLGLGTRAYRVFDDEITRTLLLVSVAYALVLVSLLSYLLLGSGGPSSRLEFASLAAAMGLIFYLLLHSSTF